MANLGNNAELFYNRFTAIREKDEAQMILLPSSGPDDWRRFLSEPDKHWRTGFSARSLAYCWEQADGLPSEIANLFSASSDFEGQTPELLLAVPEHKVPLPGGTRESQNDVFALRTDSGSSPGANAQPRLQPRAHLAGPSPD